MTGYGSREMVVEAVRRGARGFLLKPSLPADLQEVVAGGATLKSRHRVPNPSDALPPGVRRRRPHSGVLAPLVARVEHGVRRITGGL